MSKQALQQPDLDRAPEHHDAYEPTPLTRRIAGAMSIIALFVLVVVSVAFDPLPDRGTNADQVAAALGHLGTVRALGFVELGSALAAIGTVLAFAGLTRRRSRKVGNAAVLLGVLGACGQLLIAVHHWFLVALLPEGSDTAVEVLDRLDSTVGPVALPMLLVMPVALLLFAIAAYRTRLIPWPALALAVIFVLGDAVPMPIPSVVPLLVGLIAFSWIAVESLRPTPSSYVVRSAGVGRA